MITKAADGFHIFHAGQYLKGPFKERADAEQALDTPELKEMIRRRGQDEKELKDEIVK